MSVYTLLSCDESVWLVRLFLLFKIVGGILIAKNKCVCLFLLSSPLMWNYVFLCSVWMYYSVSTEFELSFARVLLCEVGSTS